MDPLTRQQNRAERMRLILREKAIFEQNPLKIILLNDFLVHAVFPAIERQKLFAKIFKAYGTDIFSNITAMIQTGQAPGFEVPYEAIEGATKDYIDKELTERTEAILEYRKLQAEQSARAFLTILGIDASEAEFHDLSNYEASKNDIVAKFKKLPHAATYQAVLVPAMQECKTAILAKIFGGLTTYEGLSNWCGENEALLAFWQSVNNLKDYSGLFPDRPPRGGDDHTGRVRVERPKPRAGIWKPTFGGA